MTGQEFFEKIWANWSVFFASKTRPNPACASLRTLRGGELEPPVFPYCDLRISPTEGKGWDFVEHLAPEALDRISSQEFLSFWRAEDGPPSLLAAMWWDVRIWDQDGHARKQG